MASGDRGVMASTEPLTSRPQRAPTITINTADVDQQERTCASNHPLTSETRLSADTLRPPDSPNSLVVSSGRSRLLSVTSLSDGETLRVSGSISEYSRSRSASEATMVSVPTNRHSHLLQPSSGDHIVPRGQDGPFGISPETLEKTFEERSLEDFYAIGGSQGLAAALRSDCSSGVSLEETLSDGTVEQMPLLTVEPYSQRKDIFGCNRLPEKKIKTVLQLMWIALNDKVLILLTVVATISLALGLYQTFFQPHRPGQPKVEWVEGVTIMTAVIIVVVVTALNDYQKERQFAKLNTKKEDRLIKAIRSGKSIELSVYDIVVGDLLHLESGDLVPADGILVSGHNVRCDESSISGESDHRKKTPGGEITYQIQIGATVDKLDPFIISGSKVLEGMGTYMVTAVGAHSTYGKTMMSLVEDNEPTPLQLKLTVVADQIAIAGISAAVLLFAVLSLKFFVELPTNMDSPSEKGQAFLRIVIVSIAVVVIAVPEGLPLAITLALAIAVTRMLKDNNLVRILGSCETMGSATTVCCDKTGTLTTNKMTVVAGTVGMKSQFSSESVPRPYRDNEDENGNQNDPGSGQVASARSINEFISLLSEPLSSLLSQSIVINSTAFEGEADGKLTFIGSRTETALLSFANERLGIRPVAEERANFQVVQIIPFDSSRKCMASVVDLGGIFRMYVKGAPEILLENCSLVVADATYEDVKTSPLSDHQDLLDHVIQDYSNRSLRTIGFAYRDFPCWPPPDARTLEDDPSQAASADIMKNMTFLGIFGIQDPLRPGVQIAVSRCRKAGVSVRMVTGDNIGTAKAIAIECGILDDDGLCMDGPTFRRLSESETYRVLPRLQVLARSNPEDKKLLVKRLKELGEVVAVTGDGTNDGPALRAADVGFSMGISGTDIAREASSIILMDDNFSSVVKAIEWGRTVNDAIKKFLQFQLTVNITAVTLTFVSAITSEHDESILTPVQLLWVNLIMDTFAALALATDPPSPSILDRRPEPKSAPLVSLTMWKMIIVQSIYQLAVTLTLNFAGNQILGYTGTKQESLETVVFNTYVWMQFFNQYNNRRLDNGLNVFEGILKNWYFLGINLITIAGQLLIIFFGGSALSAVRLDGTQWAISLGLGATSLVVGVVVRLIPDHLLGSLSFVKWQPQAESHSRDPHDGTSSWDDPRETIREEEPLCRREIGQEGRVRLGFRFLGGGIK